MMLMWGNNFFLLNFKIFAIFVRVHFGKIVLNYLAQHLCYSPILYRMETRIHHILHSIFYLILNTEEAFSKMDKENGKLKEKMKDLEKDLESKAKECTSVKQALHEKIAGISSTNEELEKFKVQLTEMEERLNFLQKLRKFSVCF